MTNDSGNPEDEKPRPYRNPPIEHRFKKGQSGNPKGRPRQRPKPRYVSATMVDGKPGVGLESRFAASILDDAYRLVTVRENGRTMKMPLKEALIRRFGIEALTGRSPALAREYLRYVSEAEAGRAVADTDVQNQAMRIKRKWARDVAEHQKFGRMPPEQVPHPDDINIDLETGAVSVDGPINQEQRDDLDALHAWRWDIHNNLQEIKEDLAANPNDLKALRLKRTLIKILETLDADNARKEARRKKYGPKE